MSRKPFTPEDYNQSPANQEISIIIGRFQPFHKGHLKLIESASYPVVVIIVKGKESSSDHSKNPFSTKLQMDLIQHANINKIKFMFEVPEANIPQIFSDMRDLGLETKEIICGTDQYKGYKRMSDNYISQLNGHIDVKLVDRDETSKDDSSYNATEIREAIKRDDFRFAHERMINLNINIFNQMKEYLQ